MKKPLLNILASLGLASLVAACGGGGDDTHEATAPAPTPSVAQTAVKTADLSTLVAALQYVDEGSNDKLLPLLANPGTLTVFAPTNAAFDALAIELLGPGKAAADLLVPSLKDTVRDILKYHVLASKVLKADVPLGKAIDPVLAGNAIFKIDATGGKVLITDGRNRTAEITATDILASNGVVHLINKVILPANQNIVETAIASNPEFSILVEAVQAAGLAGTLSSSGPFTVFAPTDQAFANLLAELGVTKAQLLANTTLLTQVLTYHVVGSRVLKADVPVGVDITTVETGTFKVGATLAITDQRARTSNIVGTDVLTSNGVIHVIDRVLLPAAK